MKKNSLMVLKKLLQLDGPALLEVKVKKVQKEPW